MTGGITRRHIVHDHAPDLAAGLISIVGGKITTYRNLAEQTVDMVFRKLGRSTPPCRTGEVPLPGGGQGAFEQFAAAFKATSGLSEDTSTRLLRLYGSRSADLLELADGTPELLEPIGDEPATLGVEVPYAVRFEHAERLGDLLMRRTMIGYGHRAGIGADSAAADLAQRHVGWSEERAREEVESYRSYMRRYRPRSLEDVAATAA